MRAAIGIVFLMLLASLFGLAGAHAQTKIAPGLLPVLEPPLSPSDLEQKLKKLKVEREALDAELQKAPRQGPIGVPSFDQEEMQIQARLRAELFRLQQERKKRAMMPTTSVKDPPKAAPPPPGKEIPASPPPEPKVPATESQPISSNILDPLHLGHALFRVGEYKEALSSLRMVDLTGKKAEERAPIQYLMATCLEHLGQRDEAIALYREAGNSRGDPSVAGYAQWQIDMLRWQRETLQKLLEIRKRRSALEKSP